MKLTPFVKGLITGTAMIAVVLAIYYSGKDAHPAIQYLIYLIYGAGIVWSVKPHTSSSAFTGKFGDAFAQGFKCFVVVTLLMALFYWVFNATHPEFAEETSLAYRDHLIREKQTLPHVIDTEVATFKKQYTLKLVSGAIFGYLIIGAAVTAIISAISTRRK